MAVQVHSNKLMCLSSWGQKDFSHRFCLGLYSIHSQSSHAGSIALSVCHQSQPTSPVLHSLTWVCSYKDNLKISRNQLRLKHSERRLYASSISG